MRTYLTIFLTILLCLTLSACGGGGSDSPDAATTRPVLVNAGTDLQLLEQESSPLSGTASGGNGTYTYEWRANAPVVIDHPDTTMADASVMAPVVTVETSFNLTLVATDSEGKSGSKTISLIVNPINELPTAVISANTIENYAPLSYPVGVDVILSAAMSSDPDPQTEDADIAAYLWQQVAGLNVLDGVQVDQQTLRFSTSSFLEPLDVDIMLTVTDQEGGEATERMSLTLLGERGTLPHVSVSKSLSVFSGEHLPLYAEIGSDAPGNAPFTSIWQHDFTRFLNLQFAEQVRALAIAPAVSEPTAISFELTATDAKDNQMSQTLTHTVNPAQRARINDTGLALYARASNMQVSYPFDYPGQDAQYGNDRLQTTGSLQKTGRGENGFDFTRLNDNGDPVDDLSLPFSCVRDNITGLVWEIKNTDAGSIHNANSTFTWYQDEGEIGGFEGDINAQSESCELSGDQCNTQAFVEQVNQAGRCGFFDWRLPTHAELQSILHYGKDSAPLIDTFYFPNTGSSPSLWYWTRQSSADGVNEEIARNAWAIDFASGVDNFWSKSSEHRVRLVRAGRNSL
ncbi:DUF1566 domain-containing protein [Glaciecola siphonariae]|uniref:DUF1566 domain-containing protein n=1 Tax=Glaciecola siphonariae TaxID=521012 RepID=A0ABV9M026_9ALTE